MIKLKIFFLCLFFLSFKSHTITIEFLSTDSTAYSAQLIEIENKAANEIALSFKPHPLRFLYKKKISSRQRFVAAVLAFPFPFGIVGLHRIYMGTKPHVPVIYIATFGGAFGVLPFIDFCILVLDKKPERYFNNPRLFMWVEPEGHPQLSSQQTP
jgi:TM2 domain-containing membrane protein YozV